MLACDTILLVHIQLQYLHCVYPDKMIIKNEDVAWVDYYYISHSEKKKNIMKIECHRFVIICWSQCIWHVIRIQSEALQVIHGNYTLFD